MFVPESLKELAHVVTIIEPEKEIWFGLGDWKENGAPKGRDGQGEPQTLHYCLAIQLQCSAFNKNTFNIIATCCYYT